MNELLKKLMRRTTLTDKLLLTDLLEESIEEIKTLSRQKEDYVTEYMQTIIIQLTLVKINRLGNEGINNMSISGASESYEEGVPESIKKQIYGHRKPPC
ncbi:MAG: phage head-tail connector protein [Sarcina sp.]